MIERPHALHRAVRELAGERAVALVEAVGGGPERAVGVRVVLEDAPEDLERRAGRAGAARRSSQAASERPS